MSYGRYSTFGEYSSNIRGIIYSHFNAIVDPVESVINITTDRKVDTLYIKVVFKDQSQLDSFISYSKKNGTAEVSRYGFHYKRDSGYFMHYHKDILDHSGISDEEELKIIKLQKPECHMHIGVKKESCVDIEKFPPEIREHDGPHYETKEITFNYLLSVIVINFFPDKRNIINSLI